MWWLVIPVIIYSSGLLALWASIARRSNGADAGDAGQPEAGEAMAASMTGQHPLTGDNGGVPETDALHGAGVSEAPQEPTGLPAVSVIVAARNEERHIETLLGSLVKQDYPDGLLEIIIVNDNSTDRTPVAASEFIEADKGMSAHRIRLIYNPFSGKKRAVRYGIEKSSGEVILTTDADCVVGPEWVRRHASWYTSGGPDVVLAPVIQKPAEGFWHGFGAYEFAALQAITEASTVPGHPVMCNAANMSFRRDVYLRHAEELHPDLPSGDDMFLLHAVKRDGGTVRHEGSNAAAAVTAGAVTAAALLRQRARWASKAGRYRDPATLTLAAATAACNAAVATAVVTACMSVEYLLPAAVMYGVKALPDYLLIATELKKRGARVKAMLFMVSEILYPFWFVTVAVMSLFPSSRRFRRR
ncbi:MAG TPA: glycosyltransferase [Bacteroidales bacterium]|nr:glycosyltransferase [Bacteroidales bacterium]